MICRPAPPGNRPFQENKRSVQGLCTTAQTEEFPLQRGELELIQTQMAQKPMLRAEVGMCVGGVEVLCFLTSTHHSLYDFDLRATHARTLRPVALASVSFGFVLVRIQVRGAQRRRGGPWRGVPKRLNIGALSSMQKQTQKRLKSGFKIIS